MRSHKDFGKLQQYELKFFYGGSPPHCKCECGNLVEWHNSFNKFNDFITGHNKAGFNVKQPELTEELLERRRVATRLAYKERGDEIKKKISESLKRTYESSTLKEKLSIKQKNIWSDPIYKERMSKIRKRVWAEHHDELVAKIWTKEARNKISEANLSRDTERTSKSEQKFIEHLKSVFGNQNVFKKHLNIGSEYRFQPDVYIQSLNVYVEFDGIYYHGLQSDSEWTLCQLHNMTRDMVKNRIAERGDYNLVRIKEDSAWSNIHDKNTLLDCAYYVCIDSNVNKKYAAKLYDNTVIVSKQSLLQLQIKLGDEEYKKLIKTKYVPELSTFLLEYVRSNGWIYPDKQYYQPIIPKEIQEVCLDNIPLIPNAASKNNRWLKSRFNSYWDVLGGPHKLFEKKIHDVLLYRLGCNNSKRNYLVDGINHELNETFDLTLKEIRKGFQVQRLVPSFFNSDSAFYIWKFLCGDNKNPVVWDPSGGFGGRMLGFSIAFPAGKYYSCEPAESTRKDLISLSSELGLNSLISDFGSENISFDEDVVFDAVMTSPPYWNKEKYYDSDGQCWKVYKNEQEWEEIFLYQTFKTAYKHLKSDGKMLINFDIERNDSCIRQAQKAGFLLVETRKFSWGRDHFDRNLNRETKDREVLLLFSKS